jgi:hypothetical protein
MKKVGLVFLIAVFVPSLVLAWLALRSLRDQQFVLERQQSLLFQGVTDSLAKQAADSLDLRQSQFGAMVEEMYSQSSTGSITRSFDTQLRTKWPVVEVGFVVTLSGNIVCPSPASRPEARAFCDNNGRFLSCAESAEVYWNTKQVGNNAPAPNFANNSLILKLCGKLSWTDGTEHFASGRRRPGSIIPELQFRQENMANQGPANAQRFPAAANGRATRQGPSRAEPFLLEARFFRG